MAKNNPITIHTPFGELTGHPARVKSLVKYYENPKICKQCGKVILVKDNQNVGQTLEKEFCDSACAAIYNNKHKNRKYKCLYCGTNLTVITHRRKYCNANCQRKYERDMKMRAGTASDRLLKQYLIDTKGHICEICGLSVWISNPITLELDHIDGNHKNRELNNLRLLCPNCHAQTPTYKARNRGNGRYLRRKRYSEGKSY